MTEIADKVREEIARERAELAVTLDAHMKLVTKYAREAQRANEAHAKTVKDPDAKPTQKELDARAKAETADRRLWGAHDAAESVRAQIDLLDNPAAIEQRVENETAKRERLAGLRERSTTMTARAPKTESKPADPALTARIVKMVKTDGLGVAAVSKILDAENAPLPGRMTKWTPGSVWNIVTKALDGKKITDVRPRVSRKLADQPAKPTAAAPKKTTGNLAAKVGAQVKPDPKPSTKKKTTARKTTASAKKTGTARKTTAAKKTTARKTAPKS